MLCFVMLALILCHGMVWYVHMDGFMPACMHVCMYIMFCYVMSCYVVLCFVMYVCMYLRMYARM